MQKYTTATILQREMSGSGAPEIGDPFLHTAAGVTTVAVAVAVLTSVVWVVALLVCYWYYRYHQRQRNSGATDVLFMAASPNNGTLASSAAGDITPHFSYSLNSLAAEPAFHHTSMESILSGELESEDNNPP